MGSDFVLSAAAFSLTALMCFLAGMAFMGSVMRKASEAAIRRAVEDERARTAAWTRGLIEQGEREIRRMSSSCFARNA